MDYTYVLGVKLHLLTIKQAIAQVFKFIDKPSLNGKQQHYIATINPEIALKGLANEQYQITLNTADISLTDGVGLQIASFIFGQPIPERITGVDFSLKLLKIAEQNNYPIFLLGTKNSDILKKTSKNIKKQFPNLIIRGMDTGPFFDNIHDLCSHPNLKATNQKLINKIKQSKAKIIFVAFGAPKQEQWIKEYLPQIPNIKLAIGVGGTMDYFSGLTKRAPRFLRSIGFEWLFRVIKEPYRFSRIFKATCVFIAHIVYWRIRMIFLYRPNVLGIFVNKDKKVLIVQNITEPRIWKFPQGGRDRGEKPSDAIYREMEEELGTNKFKIKYFKKNFHKYKWKKTQRGKYGYKGQKQYLFILDFYGDDKNFDIENFGEIIKYKWVTINDLVNSISDIRKKVAKEIQQKLKKLYD